MNFCLLRKAHLPKSSKQKSKTRARYSTACFLFIIKESTLNPLTFSYPNPLLCLHARCSCMTTGHARRKFRTFNFVSRLHKCSAPWSLLLLLLFFFHFFSYFRALNGPQGVSTMVSTSRPNHIGTLLNFTNRTQRPVIQPHLDPEEATG